MGDIFILGLRGHYHFGATFKNVLSDNQRQIFDEFLELRKHIYVCKISKTYSCRKYTTKASHKFNILLETLSGEQVIFIKDLKNFFTDGFIRDPLDKFNTLLAQRWTFKRVLQLGWSEHIHGRYTNSKNRHIEDRDSESIGEKYQWIAFYELLARVSDNFQFVDQYERSNVIKYLDLQQVDNIRNIDPSSLRIDFSVKPNVNFKTLKSILKSEKIFKGMKAGESWISSRINLPNIKKIIETVDERKDAWLLLSGSITWQSKMSYEESMVNTNKGILNYIINSYIIEADKCYELISTLKRKESINIKLPGAQELTNTYLGEYPRIQLMRDAKENKELSNKVSFSKTFEPWLLHTTTFLKSDFRGDFSEERAINIRVPSLTLVDGMQLAHLNRNGCFFNEHYQDKLVAFDPSLFDKSIPPCLMVKKEELIHFLRAKRYAIVWTLLVEKYSTAITHKQQRISGIYTYNHDDKIIGSRIFD